MPGETGVTVVTMLVCSFYFACEAAGASSARHSLRPLFQRAGRFQQNSREMRGEIAKSYLPSLRGAKRRSNPELSYPRDGLLRFARNDVLKTPCVLAV
jgi:hypothetical protein